MMTRRGPSILDPVARWTRCIVALGLCVSFAWSAAGCSDPSPSDGCPPGTTEGDEGCVPSGDAMPLDGIISVDTVGPGGDLTCTPECTDKECGDDGCGDSCGACPDVAPYCVENICSITCTIDCDGKACGDDGCGGSCGECPESFVCGEGACSCLLTCEGKLCGGDGCGGSCGECPGVTPHCIEGECSAFCQGDCAGKECGDDGCGADCGTCPLVAPYCVDHACAVSCQPECAFKKCGEDGCGGTCGDCPAGSTCEAYECLCIPNCEGKACGDNGCGDECGVCLGDTPFCIDGECSDTCVPECGGMECGDDGCGGTCGTCPQVAPYCVGGLCDITCTPDCSGKQCGDNGCLGICGTCGPSEACSQGICVCVPDCEGKECGEDGCGGSCGACSDDAPYCTGGVCQAECKPTCGGKECGPNGCGGVCGECPEVAPFCDQGTCAFEACTPSCDGKTCGDDGCGGSCGLCPDSYVCLANSVCQIESCTPDCLGKQCGSDGCGDLCGECPAGLACQSDLCIEVSPDCPIPVIVILEGEEVIPQTKLHLNGAQSVSANGAISQYQWSVDQPGGSQSVFLPSDTASDPIFEVNVAGIYTFKLSVWDQDGKKSCVDAQYTVFVNPDEAIHVELLWHTPLDPDQTDQGPEAGADLDLHFLHPYAAGEDLDGDGKPDGWFDQPFDCFWFNADPNWGSLNPNQDDDPGLDLDDTDGAGPENLNMNNPEFLTYRVGVHYWNDHGFGSSLATVRVYVYSQLVFELSGVELVNHDMWEVATIHWPSGDVELITDESGNYKIIPNYQHPFFFQE